MKTSRHSLIDRFARAGLNLELAKGPLARTDTTSIVQLDISRGRTPSDERFRLWVGAVTNRIEVQGIDPRLEQLVLMIHEPRRRFEVEMNVKAAERAGLPIVRANAKKAWIERFTDDRKRHFLCGMDEQHCFIAQLPWPASTVERAHAALRPANLHTHQLKDTRRQGEFFFLDLKAEELKRYQQLGRGILPRANAGIALAAGWARAGRQHLAEQVWVLGQNIVLVTGSVRHPDHATVRFPEWVRVLQNREAYEAPPPGVLWVD